MQEGVNGGELCWEECLPSQGTSFAKVLQPHTRDRKNIAGSQELPKPRCLRLQGAPETTWKVSRYAESWFNQPGERCGSKVVFFIRFFFHQVSADVGVVGSLPPTPCTTHSMLLGIPTMLQWCLG